MSFDEILVALFSIGGIVFTYWFFLMKKEEIVRVKDSVDILVNGGYRPEAIEIPNNKTTTIKFTRSDPSSCLEEVVLPDFKVRRFLPLNDTVEVKVTPKKKGTYQFACGMNMYHGKIIVR